LSHSEIECHHSRHRIFTLPPLIYLEASKIECRILHPCQFCQFKALQLLYFKVHLLLIQGSVLANSRHCCC
jgi:hypothetical protein